MKRVSLRTPETQERYFKAREEGRLTPLSEVEPIREFEYFKIIDNEFPHDKDLSVHHLLIPKRVIQSWKEMTTEELEEFKIIDDYVATKYDFIKRNYPSIITVPTIVHWHLCTLRMEEV